MNNNNYIDYRCIDPVAVNVGEPWFRISDSCPCNPSLSNQTGRGYTACPLGVQFDQKQIMASIADTKVVTNNNQPMTVNQLPGGSLFPKSGNVLDVVPPKAQPRPLARIGQTWRSAWA